MNGKQKPDFGFRPLTEKEKAEQHVRGVCKELMELSFGCQLFRHDGELNYTVMTSYGFGNNMNKIWVASAVHGKFDIEYNDMYEVDKSFKDTQDEKWTVIGHTPHLENWTTALWKEAERQEATLDFNDALMPEGKMLVRLNFGINKEPTNYLQFNLTTGQPATEADYKAYNEIVGV